MSFEGSDNFKPGYKKKPSSTSSSTRLRQAAQGAILLGALGGASATGCQDNPDADHTTNPPRDSHSLVRSDRISRTDPHDVAENEPMGQREVFEGIEIIGDPAFLSRTRAAISLLQRSRSFQDVKPYLKRIVQSSRSGMRTYAEVPTYEAADRTSMASTTWYAGSIAHDTNHSRLYQQSQNDHPTGEADARAWTGTEAESKCLRFQLRVLQELHADSYTLDYVRRMINHPTYQGDPDSQTDYQRRDW